MFLLEFSNETLNGRLNILVFVISVFHSTKGKPVLEKIAKI